MTYDVFNKTVQGYNHIKNNNKPCEDASGSTTHTFYREGKSEEHDEINLIVVADGHGGDDYVRTNKGSQFAVDSVIECAEDFVKYIDENFIDSKKNEELKDFAIAVLNKWHEKIFNDYKNTLFTEAEINKVSEKYKKIYNDANNQISIYDSLDIVSQQRLESKIAKAYGTTLIVFLVEKDYTIGMQIGDGKCVAFNEKLEPYEPIPWDENCEFNVTTSLCDGNAIDEFRYFKSKEKPLAVFIGSDGVDDSYASMEEVYNLYLSMLRIFKENGREIAEKEIEEYLPILSKKGSGDDISIAGMVELNMLKDVVFPKKEKKENRFSPEQQKMVDDFKKMDKELLDNEKEIEMYEQKKEKYEQKKIEILNAKGITEEEYSEYKNI